MIRRLRYAVISLSLIAGAVTALVYFRVKSWSQSPVVLPAETVFKYEPGTSLAHLARDLSKAHVIDDELWFQIYVRFVSRNYRSFQSGTYRFDGQVTPIFIIEKMIRGESYHPIVLTIPVPEGFTIKSLIERLAAHGVGTHAHIKALTRDASFLKRWRIPAQSVEGYVYPATYNFYSMPTATDALGEMIKTFWQNLPQGYEQNVGKMGLSLHQAVTFASLIEMETQADEERPLVSEVIWRRLKDKAPLGIDAALIYGIPDYAGDLKWSHLSDASNSYNTRIHKGLPPGPIGSPSRASLEAVLKPAHEGNYYYVLKAGTTRHTFSKTLAEHNRHVKELVAALRAKRHDQKDEVEGESGAPHSTGTSPISGKDLDKGHSPRSSKPVSSTDRGSRARSQETQDKGKPSR